MLKNDYDIEKVKDRYNLNYNNYGILLFHPVTTEVDKLSKHIKVLVDAIIDSKKDLIVIYPNNDIGNDIILNEYKRFNNNPHISIFPSIRFEYFLTLLKNADFVIGNSSLGIRESGIYGIPTINVGSRQDGRYDLKIQKNICCVDNNYNDISNAIDNIDKYRYKVNCFGDGKSSEKIFKILKNDELWKRKIQKKFISIF